MPSPTHEGMLAIVRDAPAVLAHLLALRGVRVELGALVAAPESHSMADLPVYVADLCFVERGPGDVAHRAWVVEVQSTITRDKLRVWPLLVAGTAARHACDAHLVVLTADRKVARWALGLERRSLGSLRLAPIVLGPDDVPRAERAETVAMPELAVLAAIVHADVPTADVAIRAVARLDDEMAHRYKDLVWAALPSAARALLEEIMKTSNWQPLSDDFRRERALGRAEGREEGRDEGARDLVKTLCAAVGVEWTDARARAVAAMTHREIDGLAATLAATRAWPDEAG